MTRWSWWRLGIAAVIAVCTVGCAYPLSPMQRRQVTTRVLDGSFEQVYGSALTVLQDRGYQIERTDRDSGLVRGRRREHEAGSGGPGSALLGLAILAAAIAADQEPEFDSDPAADPTLDLTFVVTPIDGERTEIRALLVRPSGNVYDTDVYQRLFSEIAVEVRRKAAMTGTSLSGIGPGGPR